MERYISVAMLVSAVLAAVALAWAFVRAIKPRRRPPEYDGRTRG